MADFVTSASYNIRGFRKT